MVEFGIHARSNVTNEIKLFGFQFKTKDCEKKLS